MITSHKEADVMQARSNVRIEEDALGNVEVPGDHLWGCHGRSKVLRIALDQQVALLPHTCKKPDRLGEIPPDHGGPLPRLRVR